MSIEILCFSHAITALAFLWLGHYLGFADGETKTLENLKQKSKNDSIQK